MAGKLNLCSARNLPATGNMHNLDKQAYDSYRNFTVSLGQEPLPLSAWQERRWKQAKPRHGTASDMTRIQRRAEARVRMAIPAAEPRPSETSNRTPR